MPAPASKKRGNNGVYLGVPLFPTRHCVLRIFTRFLKQIILDSELPRDCISVYHSVDVIRRIIIHWQSDRTRIRTYCVCMCVCHFRCVSRAMLRGRPKVPWQLAKRRWSDTEDITAVFPLESSATGATWHNAAQCAARFPVTATWLNSGALGHDRYSYSELRKLPERIPCPVAIK